MQQFAEGLRRVGSDYLHGPLIDSTGLEGSWDFELTWTPRSSVPPAGGERTSLFEAVDKQLGLKIELQQVPTPVMVVDHVNERPTPNLPGTAEVLPARAPEFDVAAIKLSPRCAVWL